MAASNVIFNISRSSLPQSPASQSSSTPSLKTSKVSFFTSSCSRWKPLRRVEQSLFGEGRRVSTTRNGGQKSRNATPRRAYDDKDWSRKAKQTLDEDIESGKQSFEDLKGAAAEYAKDTADNLKGAAATIGDKTKEGSDKAAKYAADATEKAKDAAESVAAKAKEGSNTVAESATSAKDSAVDAAESGAGTIKDKANEGTSKTADAVKGLKL